MKAAAPSKDGDTLAFFLLVVGPVLACSNMLVARMTADLVAPTTLAFGRWALTFLLLLPFYGPKLWHHRAAIRDEWKDLLLLGAMGMGVCGAFVYIGADTTTATNIGLIYAASPVLIILMARFGYGEALSKRQGLGVAICLAGVLAIIAKGDPASLGALEFSEGDLWIVAAAVGWAIYSVQQNHRPSAMGMMTRLTATTGAGLLVLLPFTVWEIIRLDAGLPQGDAYGYMMFLALVPGLAAYAAYARIQTSLGASKAGLVMYLIPLYNGVLAYLLLDEVPQLYHLIGAGLVLPGLWLATRR